MPGLSREEVARRAGVSVPYYIRLEQGRNKNPSAQVLEALGRALELDGSHMAYLSLIAGRGTPVETLRPDTENRPDGQLEAIIDALFRVPAIAVDVHGDIAYANPLASALDPDFSARNNLFEYIFLNPASRERQVDWRQVAELAVGQLRVSVARFPHDEKLAGLVRTLFRGSPEFAEIWHSFRVAPFTRGRSMIKNPVIGIVALDYLFLHLPDFPDLTVQLFLPAGAADAGALDRLPVPPLRGPH